VRCGVRRGRGISGTNSGPGAVGEWLAGRDAHICGKNSPDTTTRCAGTCLTPGGERVGASGGPPDSSSVLAFTIGEGRRSGEWWVVSSEW
jgi:hypothetical protein